MAISNENSRVKKTLLNAKVNLTFYFLSLIVSFVSRKIFIDALGVEFFGLIATLQGFLGFLSLLELGIGQSIGFALYKPLFDNDRKQINEIVSVLGYLYYIVGMIILGGGIVASLFFPLIFAGESHSLLLVYTLFYSFLGATLLSYFVNYRQSLLGADQRYYVVSAYTQGTSLICTVIQIAVIFYTSNPYLWILISIITSIINSIFINWKINKQYPWLQTGIRLGRQKYKDYPDIIKKTKQLFVHKIATFVQYRIQPLIMYAFAPLKSIGMYDNYSLVTARITDVVNQALNGSTASVGNLIAEGNKANILKVYWELSSFRFLAAGVFAFCVWNLTEAFITLWLGPEMVMSNMLLALIVANMFIRQVRNTTDMFIAGHGLFRDVWAPITEMSLSVIIAVVGGIIWGLEGVLLGPLVSLIIIVGIWKPYFLFTHGIKESVWTYWFNFARYMLCFAAAFAICQFTVIATLTINPASGFLSWIIYALIIGITFLLVYSILLYMFSAGFSDILSRLTSMLTKNKRQTPD